MPQLQTLVLKDRKATPVNHDFTPRDITSGVATVAESSGTPIGDNRLTLSLTKTQQGRIKPSLRFTFPVVQDSTINGVVSPVVVRTAYVEMNFSFDQTSSEAERNDIVGMVQDALASNKTLTNDLIVKLQGVY